MITGENMFFQKCLFQKTFLKSDSDKSKTEISASNICERLFVSKYVYGSIYGNRYVSN